VDEKGNARVQSPRQRPRLLGRGLLVLVALLLIFHRPIIFGLGRSVANRYAARENLKIDCSLGGTIFTGLVIRNLHVVPIGPAIVESIDVDYIRADYSLWDLWRRGATDALKNVEMRAARIVLDPAKAPLKPRVPRPDERITLFPIFPERLRLFGVNLHVRAPSEERDFVLEHLDLELDPKKPGELHLATLQIPSAPAWKNISAQTSYTNRNLIVRDLVLDPENRFQLIGIDASRIGARALEMVLDATLAHGTVTGSVALSETAHSLQTKLRLVAEKVSLDTLFGYLGRPPEFLSGTVERLAIESSGAIDSPRTWDAKLEAQVNNLRRADLTFDRCVVNVTAHDGVATLQSGEATKGLNKIEMTGSAELPEQIRSLGQSPATFDITGSFPDLPALTGGFAQPLTGSANVNGKVEIKEAILQVDARFGGGPIGAGNGTIAQVKGTLAAKKKMPPLGPGTVSFAGLQTEVHLDLADLRSGDYLLDSVHADLRSEGAAVQIERIVAVRNQNTFTAAGEYQLPDDFAATRMQPARLDVSLRAPNLADFWAVDAQNRITGPLQITGEVTLREGKAQGQVSVYGSNLTCRNLIIPRLSAQASVWNNVVYLNDFTASLNERDYMGGSGTVSLDKPYRYSGKVNANVADLARLKPLLVAAGNNNEIAGSLLIDWQGSGEAAEFKNSGKLKLTLEKGRYANLQALQANIDASYSPDGLDVPTIFLGSDKMDFQAILAAKGSTLEISKIQIHQGKAKYASGNMSLPFVWKNIGTSEAVFPSDGKVLVTFQSERLDLGKLFADLGMKPLATGLVNVKVDAQGTLAQLRGRLDLQMSDLHSSDYPKLEPAALNLVAELQNNQLALNGRLQQAKIQPVQITANLPFDVSTIIARRKFDEATPLTAKVQLPRSPVNFLRQFLPAITQLDGDLTLDASVNGTLAKPVLSGSGDITINRARFSNPTLPALSGFHSRLTFAGDALNFERFRGDLAGGPFTISGRVTFPKLTQPNLDFQLKAQSILIARSDSLTARADADLKVLGPWASAAVTGSVALTNSQFLKNIDLIPIGLPGRPAPQPPSERPDFSVTEPPIRDWKFDIAIKTRDPFLLRGNLANGGAIVDLRLTGTGLQPALQGVVRLENVEATLPFSRLDIARGFLYFDPSDSFNPKIDLHGTSLIRDYTVHVYVYGTSLAPEALFSSEPPLPQEEIISLLATGVTRGELTGNNNVLAGRAAMLLVQQLYQKIFKKGQTAGSNSALDRLQVDVGNIDPRTGQQTATARFKVNDRFVLIGDLGVGGDFRGMVRYLIRFK